MHETCSSNESWCRCTYLVIASERHHFPRSGQRTLECHGGERRQRPCDNEDAEDLRDSALGTLDNDAVKEGNESKLWKTYGKDIEEIGCVVCLHLNGNLRCGGSSTHSKAFGSEDKSGN